VLDLIAADSAPAASVTVPAALSDYVIEAGRASDYDHLLLAAGGAHD